MSVQALLDAAFAPPRPPGAGAAGGFTFSDLREGRWKEFLLGDGEGPWDRPLGELWQRVVAECGVAEQLEAEPGLVWEELPHDSKIVLALQGEAGDVVDVAAACCRTQQEAWEREARYARIHRPLPKDLIGLVPADVGALRSGLLAAGDFRDDEYGSGAQQQFQRMVTALSGTAAYLAAAHWIPAALAFDVVTTAPLDKETCAALRLPAPWSLVVHEPVPLAAAQADDAELAELIEAGGCLGRQPAILGGLLAARPDGSLDATAGFLLLAAHDAVGRRSVMLQPAAYGDHAGGRVLYGYAAQLAFARWTEPPALPEAGDRPEARSALARIARSEAGRNGAWHHVRALDFTPPPEHPPEPGPEPAGSRRPLTWGTWRRAHWKPGVRIGIRDERGRLVGPVYKDGALEGVTFTRERYFVPRTRIRRDLPLAPTTTVYRPPRSRAAG
ncbi:hypothetical protein AB0952_09495 [Streptomyces caniferus]|uniref:hypothetical protein n=1 Tax=Streptomyces caniferus TaxID=285557 RepID=UPI00345556A5